MGRGFESAIPYRQRKSEESPKIKDEQSFFMACLFSSSCYKKAFFIKLFFDCTDLRLPIDCHEKQVKEDA
jgi:hypothetical protein